MLPLPRPAKDKEQNGLKYLRGLLNVRNDDHFDLILSYLLATLRCNGPFPVLVFNSEQGTGKTTSARICAALIDPNVAQVRSLPKDERDLFIAASNRWVLPFDNVSHLPDWQSDAFCRLSTGGAGGTRSLYTNDEEFVIKAQRPVLLNGITEIVTRPDLMDRAIVIDSPVIPAHQRRSEEDIWREFEGARPAILGSLLDVLAGSMSTQGLFRPSKLPRMADFAAFMAGAEPFLAWEAGHFASIYRRNRDEGHQITLDASLIGRYIEKLCRSLDGDFWDGTATELSHQIEALATKTEMRAGDWPRTPKSLSEHLRRIIPSLRADGVHVTFRRASGGNRTRRITIRAVAGEGA
jgi:hypothetical protein